MPPLDELIEHAFDALESGAPDAALETGREALTLDPDDPDANHVVGAALLELGRLADAMGFLQRAIELDADNVEALATLGAAQFEGLDLAGARGSLQEAVALEPEYADAHHWLGLVEERAGNEQKALRHFERARLLDPKAFRVPHSVSEQEFQYLVEEAIGRLPESFRAELKNLAIMVEALPDDTLLAGAAGEPALSPGILGLHAGIPADERGVGVSGELPNTIFLFQKNIERAAASREELVEQIEVTLLHEIGHYLGLDEDEVDERGLH